MKNTPRLHCLSVISLIVLCYLTMVPSTVIADSSGMMCQILNAASQYNSDLPSCDDVTHAEQVLTCLKDHDTGYCLQTYAGTFNNDNIETVIELYVAIDNDDFWGVLAVVGDDAMCVIADLMSAGAAGGLCDLIKELAETAIKALTDVWEFLSGLGEAFVGALEGLGCALSICCCDESAPAYTMVYFYYFEPKVSDGLTAVESVDSGAFKSYVDGLINNANAKGPTYYPDPMDVIHMIGYDANDVNTAADVYRQVVYANWNSDIVQRVLPDLGNKRNQYYNDQQLLASLVNEAVNQNDPSMWIYNRCTDDFTKTFGYAQLDRWLNHQSGNATLEAEKKKIMSNSKWCSDVFEYKHRPKEFAALYRDYVNKNICPNTGTLFICPSQDKLSSCQRILGNGVSYEEGQLCRMKPPCQATVGQHFMCNTLADYKACLSSMSGMETSCGVNISAAGMELAQMIDADFKQKGSMIPCQNGVLDFSKSGNTATPASFICTRPVQAALCNKEYNDYFGSLNVPTPLLNCILAEDDNYTKLRNRVAVVAGILGSGVTSNLHPSGPANASGQKTISADGKLKMIPLPGDTDKNKMKTIQTGSGGVAKTGLKMACGNSIKVSDKDPLILEAEQCVWDSVTKDSNQDFGFGPPSSKPGFDYDKNNVQLVDGASTPVLIIGTQIGGNAVGNLKPLLTTETPESKLKKKLGSGDPGNEMLKEGMGNVVNPDMGQNVGTAGVKQNAAVSALANVSGRSTNIGAGQETQTMSGTLPAGTNLGSSLAGSQAPSTPMSDTLMPDITCDQQVRVANVPAKWGDTVNIDAAQATSKNRNNSGLCEFPIEYTVRNIGNFFAASFRSLWTNSAVSGNWSHAWSQIAVDGAKSDKDLLPLKPGINKLKLVLDDLQEMKESDEANNEFHITVNVTGSCGASAPSAPIVAPPAPAGKQLQHR